MLNIPLALVITWTIPTQYYTEPQTQGMEGWHGKGRASCQHGEELPGPRINMKTTSYQYRKSHCRDKTILRPSYLHNWISHTDKMTSILNRGLGVWCWMPSRKLASTPVLSAVVVSATTPPSAHSRCCGSSRSAVASLSNWWLTETVPGVDVDGTMLDASKFKKNPLTCISIMLPPHPHPPPPYPNTHKKQ